MKVSKYVIDGDEIIFDEGKEKFHLKDLQNLVIFNSVEKLFAGLAILFIVFSLAEFSESAAVGGLMLLAGVILLWIAVSRHRYYLGLHFNDKNMRFNGESILVIVASKSMIEIEKEVEKLDKIIESKGFAKVNMIKFENGKEIEA